MAEYPKIIKRAPSQKDKLTAEMHALEKEIEDLGSNVSESQIWHKRARIEVIKKELKALDTKQFNASNDKLKSMMESQKGQSFSPDMVSAMRAGRI